MIGSLSGHTALIESPGRGAFVAFVTITEAHRLSPSPGAPARKSGSVASRPVRKIGRGGSLRSKESSPRATRKSN